MKWVMIVVGVLVFIVLAVVAIGMTLPQNHTASRSAQLSAPADTVWKLVTDVRAFPSWRRAVDSVQVLEAQGNLKWREVTGSDRITYEATTSVAPSQFVARITDEGLPFGGSWEYAIAPEGAGSRITITERGEVYNPVFRFVSRFVMGHTATMDTYLEDLSTRVGPPALPAAR